MAKKNRKRNRATRVLPAIPGFGVDGESRPAEVMTIAWMLTFVVAVLSEVAAVAGGLLAYAVAAESNSPLVGGFIPVMFLAAAVSGGLCLLLTPFVYRLRRLKPPPVITALAVVAALIPFAVLVIWPLVSS